MSVPLRATERKVKKSANDSSTWLFQLETRIESSKTSDSRKFGMFQQHLLPHITHDSLLAFGHQKKRLHRCYKAFGTRNDGLHEGNALSTGRLAHPELQVSSHKKKGTPKMPFQKESYAGRPAFWGYFSYYESRLCFVFLNHQLILHPTSGLSFMSCTAVAPCPRTIDSFMYIP